MYTTFRIQNFRGFKDLELKDIARVNLIAGKNNVGKTSLLEAMGVFFGKIDLLLHRSRSISHDENDTLGGHYGLSGSFDLATLFNQFDTDKEIGLFFTFDDGDSNILKLFLTHFSASTLPAKNPIYNYSNSQNVAYDSYALKIHSPLINSDEYDYLITGRDTIGNFVAFTSQSKFRNLSKTIFANSRQRTEKNQLEIRLSELKRNRQTKLVLDTLNIFYDGDIKANDIQLLDDGLYVDVSNSPRLLPLNILGDGMIRLTEIILAISASKNGIILIDEIENGLHYSVQRDIWKAIAKAAEQFNVQVFATTHSREMIQAAHEAFKETPEDDFRFYRLDRDKKSGEIYATTYDQYSMEAAIEVNAEVR